MNLLAGCGRTNFGLNAADAATSEVNDAGTDRANVAFVTSTKHAGNLGGTIGADAICASSAKRAGLDGEFIALVASPSQPDPSERLVGSSGWKSPTGLWIASTLQQVSSRQFFHPLYQTENGTSIDGNELNTTWLGDTTATNSCSDWSSDQAGGTVRLLGEWGNIIGFPLPALCGVQQRISCFERGHQTSRPTPANDQPLVFVSQATWKSNAAGVLDADALCNQEAKQAGRSGIFIALLPLADKKSIERLSALGTVYQRADGEVVGSLSSLTSFLMLDASGDPSIGNIWTGGNPSRVASATCSSWTSGTGTGKIGISGFVGQSQFDYGEQNCDQPFHLYCAQQ
jgi:hypothetical protein